MDRALNGVTTIRVLRGGAIDVTGGPDMDIVRAALREDTAPLKATKDTSRMRACVSFVALSQRASLTIRVTRLSPRLLSS